jgi:hypothetical protein
MNDDKVLADWESKWLDPDYDMANGRYYEDEDEHDEIDALLDEIFGGDTN